MARGDKPLFSGIEIKLIASADMEKNGSKMGVVILKHHCNSHSLR